MAHILTRKYGSGNTRHTAVIRIRRGTTVIYREAKTFAHRSAAITWARHREVQLEDEAQLTKAMQGVQEGAAEITVAALIRWYIDTFESISKWQRSKQTHLEFLERHPFSATVALRLNVSQLVNHIKARRADGAGPATVCNDLVWIGVVLRAAKSVKGLPVQPSIVQEARTACRELRLIAKARKRDRRFAPDERARLRDYFERRDRRAEIPMNDVLDFAIESTRRQAEICRLRWEDNDARTRTGLVRDAKHPFGKEGNHRRFKYTPEAWAIVQRQPRTSEFVFPYNAKSIGARVHSRMPRATDPGPALP
jgi:integrase